MPEGKNRYQATWGIVPSWAEKEPEDAAKWAEQLSGNDRNEMMSAVACGWVKKNPEGAAKWALELPSPQDQKQVIPTTLLEPTKQELLKQLEEK